MTGVLSRGVLAAPGFVRLWIAGGIASAMLWLEVLAAALFTLQATGSPLAVAVVSAARAAPLLLVGAFVGVLADTLDRRLLVLGGLLLAAASSAGVVVLAVSGVLRPWHLGLAALVSGLVYATEMPARRRLIAELAGPALVGRAVAIDSLTNFSTRVLGPLLGGWAIGAVGIGGAYAISAACSLAGALCVTGVSHRQAVRPLSFGTVGRDLREGLAFARRSRIVAGLLGVTTLMNLCGYSYTTLVAPLGRSLHLQDVWIGVLAASEPAGALLGGLLIVRLALPWAPLAWLASGAAVLMAALATVPLVAHVGGALWPICLVLLVGGFGVAAYTNMQTMIAMREVPAELRSRVLGLVSVCVGFWPVGQLLVGALAEILPPADALPVLGLSGIVGLGLVMAAVRPR